ncbi:MAG: hypothetical protein EBZ68_01160 [Actinobacteria bacterium]|nr:hypothetical protein [Actinomycetota bacterium]
MHGCAGAASLDGVQRVLHARCERHIARHHRDADYFDVGVPQRDDKCDNIVAGSVGIDPNSSCHEAPP